ncbi:hypothetical protein PybrP1_000613 [[Pythium] brassicae (nom. inval.)]|nr:hypothetical protein PybrP1_000613 [[Pythium] brassicae (nom. inval.)]
MDELWRSEDALPGTTAASVPPASTHKPQLRESIDDDCAELTVIESLSPTPELPASPSSTLEQPVGVDVPTTKQPKLADECGEEETEKAVALTTSTTAPTKKRPLTEPVVWHLSHRPSGDRVRKKLTQLDDVAQIGFGGCGGMYNYFLGVASVLQEEYDLEDVIFSGVSAGCFPAMVLALGMDVKEFFFKENLPLIERAAACSFAGLGKWIPLVRANTLAMLPSDAFARVDKKLYFSVTEVPSLTNHVLTTWTSNEDMVDGMLCSSHVPLYTPTLTASYRGKRFVDGGLSNNSPIVHPDRPHKMLQMWKWRWISPTWVLVTTNADWALELFRMGREDAHKNLRAEIEEAFFPPGLTGEAVKRSRRA